MHASDGWVPAEGFGVTKESEGFGGTKERVRISSGWVTVSETEEKQEITGD